MQTTRRNLVLGLTAVSLLTAIAGEDAYAFRYGRRQYYGGWSYNPIQSYYYRPYYYLPTVSATRYSYHYVVHYPSQPRYYYYYNPVRRYYWGRYDLQEKGYSLLEEKDRKQKLEEIPESVFPKPSSMPSIPESTDKVAMEVAPNDVPKSPPKEETFVESAAKEQAAK